MGEFRLDRDLEERLMGADPDLLAFHKQVPISQVIQFLGVQPIIDSVVSAKRIHLIDLGLRLGAHWSIVMKALEGRSSCSVELLKLSAVGTSEEKIKKVGQQLVSFAENLKLPFIFKPVIVSDMKDIREDLFEIKSGEAAAVYSPLVMRTMIHRPGCLENLLTVIKNLKPCIMTVSEVEANHNSRSFINRFKKKTKKKSLQERDGARCDGRATESQVESSCVGQDGPNPAGSVHENFDWDYPIHLQPMSPTAVKQVAVTWDAYEATKNAHGVCILTEWDEFKALDYKRIYDNMRKPAFFFDGRKVVDVEKLRKIISCCGLSKCFMVGMVIAEEQVMDNMICMKQSSAMCSGKTA
ncbi:hypothetical protein ACLOJK_020618 [Asimina triloba]